MEQFILQVIIKLVKDKKFIRCSQHGFNKGTLLQQGIGLDDPQRSLPTPTIL